MTFLLFFHSSACLFTVKALTDSIKVMTQKPVSKRDSALSTQRRLAFTPPLFVNTEPSSGTKRDMSVHNIVVFLNTRDITYNNTIAEGDMVS